MRKWFVLNEIISLLTNEHLSVHYIEPRYDRVVIGWSGISWPGSSDLKDQAICKGILACQSLTEVWRGYSTGYLKVAYPGRWIQREEGTPGNSLGLWQISGIHIRFSSAQLKRWPTAVVENIFPIEKGSWNVDPAFRVEERQFSMRFVVCSFFYVPENAPEQRGTESDVEEPLGKTM